MANVSLHLLQDLSETNLFSCRRTILSRTWGCTDEKLYNIVYMDTYPHFCLIFSAGWANFCSQTKYIETSKVDPSKKILLWLVTTSVEDPKLNAAEIPPPGNCEWLELGQHTKSECSQSLAWRPGNMEINFLISVSIPLVNDWKWLLRARICYMY